LRRHINMDSEYIIATVAFIVINIWLGLKSDTLLAIINTGLSTFQ